MAQLIKQFIFANTSTNGRHISDLLKRMEQSKPACHRVINALLDGFRPGTAVTMCQPQETMRELMPHLKKVSEKMHSIDLNYFGRVAFDKQIHKSAVDLSLSVPKALRQIVLKMKMA